MLKLSKGRTVGYIPLHMYKTASIMANKLEQYKDKIT